MTEQTPTQTRAALRVERTFRAPAERVFDAWTSEEVLRRWFHAGGPDWETTDASVDLRVGGRVHVSMRTPEGRAFGGGGEYVEIRRPERLAFTWTWDDAPEDLGAGGLVEVTFTERDGETLVVLEHGGLGSEESAAQHTNGWNQVLANLARALAA